MKPVKFRAMAWIHEGLCFTSSTQYLWTLANEALKVLMTLDGATGGQIQRWIPGIGWTLCNADPDIHY